MIVESHSGLLTLLDDEWGDEEEEGGGRGREGRKGERKADEKEEGGTTGVFTQQQQHNAFDLVETKKGQVRMKAVICICKVPSFHPTVI